MEVKSALFRWPVLIAALTATGCGPHGLQRQDQFAWAVQKAYRTTSPPIIRVRLLDAKTGTGSIQCMFGATLIEAIMAEDRLSNAPEGYERALAIALGSPDHSFRFNRPVLQKLATWTRGMAEPMSKACKLIAQGKSAIWSDYSAVVDEGSHFPLVSDTQRRATAAQPSARK